MRLSSSWISPFGFFGVRLVFTAIADAGKSVVEDTRVPPLHRPFSRLPSRGPLPPSNQKRDALKRILPRRFLSYGADDKNARATRTAIIPILAVRSLVA